MKNIPWLDLYNGASLALIVLGYVWVAVFAGAAILVALTGPRRK